MLLVPSAASAKPHLDWCAVATTEAQRVNDVNRQLADINEAVEKRLAQLQAGGEGVLAPILQAQINAMKNQVLAVEDRKRDFDEKAALMQAKCGEQLTQTIRCFRKWELTKASVATSRSNSRPSIRCRRTCYSRGRSVAPASSQAGRYG